MKIIKVFAVTALGLFFYLNAMAQGSMYVEQTDATEAGVYVIRKEMGLFFYDREGNPARRLKEGKFSAFTVSGSTIYVSEERDALYVSTDHGTTWKSIPVNGQWINHLFLSGSRLFTSDAYSEDGQNWTQLKLGKEFMQILTMTRTGNTLIAGTSRQGVLSSTDNGNSWVKCNKGLFKVDKEYRSIINVLVIQNTWYALQVNKGIHISTDNGLTWNQINGNLPGNQYQRSISKIVSTGKTLVAGVDSQDNRWASTDNGANWSKMPNPTAPGKHSFFIDAITAYENKLYFLTLEGNIFVSEDEGATWSIYNTPAANRNALKKAADDKRIADSLYWTKMTFKGEVITTTDGGKSWTRNDSKAEIVGFQCLASDGTTLFAGTHTSNYTVDAIVTDGKSIYTGMFGGIYRSDDKGKTYTRLDKGLAPWSSANRLVINDNSLYATTPKGLYYTSLANINWTHVDPKHFADPSLKMLAVAGSKIVVGTESDIYISNDKGVSWTRKKGPGVEKLLSVYLAGDKILLGAQHGIYVSADDGQTWSDKGKSIHGVEAFTTIGTDIYMGTKFGVYKSSNGGERWAEVNEGLPLADNKVQSLASVGTTLYAGLLEGPIYALTDGKKWVNVANGLPANEKVREATEITYSSLASGDGIMIGGAKLGDKVGIKVVNSNAYDVTVKVKIAFSCQEINVGNFTTHPVVQEYIFTVSANSTETDMVSGCNEVTLGWKFDGWQKM